MSFLCQVVGHAMPKKGWYGDGLYGGEIRGGHTDGIGRTHFTAYQRCSRCSVLWPVARFHGTDVTDLLILPPPVDDGES